MATQTKQNSISQNHIIKPNNKMPDSLSRNQRQIYKAIALADANPVHLQAGSKLDISEIIQTNREEEDKENLGF